MLLLRRCSEVVKCFNCRADAEVVCFEEALGGKTTKRARPAADDWKRVGEEAKKRTLLLRNDVLTEIEEGRSTPLQQRQRFHSDETSCPSIECSNVPGRLAMTSTVKEEFDFGHPPP